MAFTSRRTTDRQHSSLFTRRRDARRVLTGAHGQTCFHASLVRNSYFAAAPISHPRFVRRADYGARSAAGFSLILLYDPGSPLGAFLILAGGDSSRGSFDEILPEPREAEKFPFSSYSTLR